MVGMHVSFTFSVCVNVFGWIQSHSPLLTWVWVKSTKFCFHIFKTIERGACYHGDLWVATPFWGDSEIGHQFLNSHVKLGVYSSKSLGAVVSQIWRFVYGHPPFGSLPKLNGMIGLKCRNHSVKIWCWYLEYFRSRTSRNVGGQFVRGHLLVGWTQSVAVRCASWV
jgi:hypothetical protein